MPQSRGSMLVSRVAVDPQPGERVLDLCAAPGAQDDPPRGADGDEGEVVAVEADPRRAAELERELPRASARDCVRGRPGDAAEPAFGDGYDCVLVDPPCSDLGTLQSRPDVRWRKDPAQVAELALAPAPDPRRRGRRPCGRGAGWCTRPARSIRRRTSAQMTDLTREDRSFRNSDLSVAYPALARGVFLQTLPHRDGTDGFFIAALERKL